MKQSSNHLLMVRPSVFYANPQTMDTNVYQIEGEAEPNDVVLARALDEFCAYRQMLVENGVIVTTVHGHPDCPDMIFPNWASTYDDGRLILYPMLNENRQAERTPEIVAFLKRYYPHTENWSAYEAQGLALESTASIVSDHVNKRAYSGLSRRTSPELVAKWAEFTGYDVISFETRSHTGIPVYHTDFLMYIGSEMAAICAECITDEDVRGRVLARLRETHEVIELSSAQLRANCGNGLEVVGTGGEKMLTFSQAALEAMDAAQLSVIRKHYNTIITPDLSTIEKYGGGSARCMLTEMF